MEYCFFKFKTFFCEGGILFYESRTPPLFNNKRKYSIFIKYIFVNKTLSEYIHVEILF